MVLCDSAGSVLRRATFTWGTCAIDLSSIDWDGISWPSGHQYETYIEMRFPENDPLFPDGYIYDSRTPYPADTSIYQARTQGITFSCAVPNSLLCRVNASSYLAEGASGVVTAVSEPRSCDQYQTGFARYAAGYTWAESAYMGMNTLSYRDVVLGDPLMAPFPHIAQPSAAFEALTPAEGAEVSGTVPVCVSASPDGPGQIQIDVRVIDGLGVSHPIGTSTQSPRLFTWGTSGFPDGEYTVVTDVTQSGVRQGITTITRPMTVSNATNPVVSVAAPVVLSAGASVSAAVSASVPSV